MNSKRSKATHDFHSFDAQENRGRSDEGGKQTGKRQRLSKLWNSICCLARALGAGVFGLSFLLSGVWEAEASLKGIPEGLMGQDRPPGFTRMEASETQRTPCSWPSGNPRLNSTRRSGS